MIIALMIGRKGSSGFPNKNLLKIFNKHLCEYPIIAAKKKINIKNIYLNRLPKIKR